MKPASFSYHEPRSVSEAVALLAEYAPQNGRVLAGGQSLVPTMAFRMAQPTHLIDINGIPELAMLKVELDKLHIGACVRHSTFDSETVPGAIGALLRKVVRNIAHHPIRTRGTFGGSVANADPSSEWCCVMAALDGTVILQSQRGTRRVQSTNFYQGIMTTVLEEDELLTRCELPVLAADTRSGFMEFSRRKGDFAVAMALVTFRLDNGKIVDPRVAIGGAETHPRRMPDAEAALVGATPSKAAFVAAAQAASAACDPMEDINNTAEYRRGVVRTMVERALAAAA